MIKIAFYKNNKYLSNRIISWWTGGPYSHVELIFDNNQWFSASSWEEKRVRFKNIEYKKEHWDVFYINKEINIDRVYNKSRSIIGKKYDWTGVLLTQVFNRRQHNFEHFFCSEACHFVLKDELSFKFQESHLYNPMNLYWDMEDRSYLLEWQE